MLTDTESADVQKCFCEMRPFEEKGTMDIKKGSIDVKGGVFGIAG